MQRYEISSLGKQMNNMLGVSVSGQESRLQLLCLRTRLCCQRHDVSIAIIWLHSSQSCIVFLIDWEDLLIYLSLLFIAFLFKSWSNMETSMASTSSLDDDQSDGANSFLRAARAGNLEKVLEYLRGSIDINTSNMVSHFAIHSGMTQPLTKSMILILEDNSFILHSFFLIILSNIFRWWWSLTSSNISHLPIELFLNPLRFLFLYLFTIIIDWSECVALVCQRRPSSRRLWALETGG